MIAKLACPVCGEVADDDENQVCLWGFGVFNAKANLRVQFGATDGPSDMSDIRILHPYCISHYIDGLLAELSVEGRDAGQ